MRDAILGACGASTITFSVSGTITLNTSFGPLDLNGTNVTIDVGNHIVIVQPSGSFNVLHEPQRRHEHARRPPDSTLVTITVFVIDDGGTDNFGANTFSRQFTLTVNPVAEPPQVTSTSTLANLRTAPITIVPEAVDGSSVQYFSVSAVTNGTL